MTEPFRAHVLPDDGSPADPYSRPVLVYSPAAYDGGEVAQQDFFLIVALDLSVQWMPTERLQWCPGNNRCPLPECYAVEHQQPARGARLVGQEAHS